MNADHPPRPEFKPVVSVGARVMLAGVAAVCVYAVCNFAGTASQTAVQTAADNFSKVAPPVYVTLPPVQVTGRKKV